MRAANLGASAILVGAPSTRDRPAISLREAYQRHAEVAPKLGLGAIVIAERHSQKGDEHERMLSKRARLGVLHHTSGIWQRSA